MDGLLLSPLLADGATGSLFFELTGRLSEPNHVYESFNLDNPELVRQAHLAYLQSGARALKTNTFDANEATLSRLGIQGRAGEIAAAGARLAREAIAEFNAGAQEPIEVFVLGSIGPAQDMETDADIEWAHRPQLEALIAGGADALLLETFDSLPAATAIVRLARSIAGCPPVILHMTLRQDQSGTWTIPPAQYVTAAAAAGASVVGVNCCAPWEASRFIEEARSLPEVKSGQVLLSAMPNAGGFERIGHRFMSRVNPEFMGRLARTLADEGVRLIGGCCEVHPGHIREMAGFLRSRAGSGAVSAVRDVEPAPAGPEKKRENGAFSARLFDGEFAVSIEMLPPRGTGPRQLAEKAALIGELAETGLAHAVDVTDGSRGIPLMPPGDFIQAARERLGWTAETGDGIEMVPHFTARDLNLMGIQSRLIGYHARRIHNVLLITGDPPKMSPSYPRSTAVFDLDSVRMIELANRRLNAGMDFGGQPLGRQTSPNTHFTIGTGYEPEALDPDGELAKLERKLDAGADYVMTQPAFHWEALSRLERLRGKARVLVGVMVLTSLAHAERFSAVPGVHVPPEVFQRFARFADPADQAKAGLELAVAQARRSRDEGWSGLYLMSPATPGAAPEILRAIQ